MVYTGSGKGIDAARVIKGRVDGIGSDNVNVEFLE
jgi:hypothetical protein